MICENEKKVTLEDELATYPPSLKLFMDSRLMRDSTYIQKDRPSCLVMSNGCLNVSTKDHAHMTRYLVPGCIPGDSVRYWQMILISDTRDYI